MYNKSICGKGLNDCLNLRVPESHPTRFPHLNRIGRNHILLYIIVKELWNNKCIILYIISFMFACMRYIRALELISMRNPFGTSYIIMNYYWAAIGESVDQWLLNERVYIYIYAHHTSYLFPLFGFHMSLIPTAFIAILIKIRPFYILYR